MPRARVKKNTIQALPNRLPPKPPVLTSSCGLLLPKRSYSSDTSERDIALLLSLFRRPKESHIRTFASDGKYTTTVNIPDAYVFRVFIMTYSIYSPVTHFAPVVYLFVIAEKDVTRALELSPKTLTAPIHFTVRALLYVYARAMCFARYTYSGRNEPPPMCTASPNYFLNSGAPTM